MHFSFERVRRGSVAIAIALAFCCVASGQANPAPQTPAAGQTPPANSAPASQSAPPSQPGDQSVQPPNTQEQPGQAEAPQDSIAQDPSGQDQGRFVFKKDVQEVVLHATVVDEAGHLVTSLDRNAFSIFQNGIPEPVTSFRREDVPVAMGIVIDNSGSMREKRDEVNRAVLNLIRASNTEDEIFVVNFSQDPILDQDFTSDVNLLQAALHQTSTRGSTALYDAVVASAVHLQHNPHLDKKVLLVITDGQDNMSRETLQDAMRKLQQNKGPVVYAIGLTAEEFTRAGQDALQNLATATGGVAFFPGSLTDVDEITRSVAHDIRSQYILVYKPQNLKPGYQAIRVEARLPGHRLTVRTRNGYFPGEPVR